MIFFTDLDNTLIYSHRRTVIGDKVCVEWLKEREQSYMTANSYSFLSSFDGAEIVPVTTRTMEQYSRLSVLSEALRVRYAIICNGGILLKNGIIDSDWLKETYDLAAGAADELEKVSALMEEYSENTVHRTERIMSYTVTDTPAEMQEKLKSQTDSSLLSIFCDNRKVYCIPSVINKGSAVGRFMQHYGCGRTSVAAGDGVQDIPMLDTVDISIPADTIYEKVGNENKLRADSNMTFSDCICSSLKKIIPERCG